MGSLALALGVGALLGCGAGPANIVDGDAAPEDAAAEDAARASLVPRDCGDGPKVVGKSVSSGFASGTVARRCSVRWSRICRVFRG